MFDWYLKNGSHDKDGNPVGALQFKTVDSLPTDISSMSDEQKEKVIANAVDFLALNW